MLQQQPRLRPNILWICTDQQRSDTIHSLGNPHIRTPNMDRLAASGVAFTNAYCQATVCTPSRASFMTGVYPSTLHVNHNGNTWFPEQHAPRLISRILSDNGYYCGLVGKLHLTGCFGRPEPRPNDGYRFFKWSHSDEDRAEDVPEANAYFQWLRDQGVDWKALREQARRKSKWPAAYPPGIETRYSHPVWCAEEAIEFMKMVRNSPPWFLSVHLFEPHPPNDPPQEYCDRMDVDQLPLPLFRKEELTSQLEFAKVDHQTTKPRAPESYPARHMKAAYYAEIELIDDQLGRILQALEANGLRENTIVVYSTDHGEMLGDHGLTGKGCRFYEGQVHVPLLMSWPEHFRAGLRSSALVGLMDIVPTLLEAVDIRSAPDYLPDEAKGKSLLPILAGKADAGRHREFVRCEHLNALIAPHRSHASMLFDGRSKLVVYHGLDVGELYDLGEDPHEFRNLWGEPAARDRKAHLVKQLFDAIMLATDPGQSWSGRF